jgi:hypothetical protein
LSGEIIETLKVATVFGQETISMVIPILAEDIGVSDRMPRH